MTTLKQKMDEWEEAKEHPGVRMSIREGSGIEVKAKSFFEMMQALKEAVEKLKFYSEPWRYTGNAPCPPSIEPPLSGEWDRGTFAQDWLKKWGWDE